MKFINYESFFFFLSLSLELLKKHYDVYNLSLERQQRKKIKKKKLRTIFIIFCRLWNSRTFINLQILVLELKSKIFIFIMLFIGQLRELSWTLLYMLKHVTTLFFINSSTWAFSRLEWILGLCHSACQKKSNQFKFLKTVKFSKIIHSFTPFRKLNHQKLAKFVKFWFKYKLWKR